MAKIKQDILNGRISRQIVLFFFPILLGTFIQQLYNTVDALIVGRYVGKVALGAVGGTSGTLINLLVGFITGVSSGATVVVAQFYGRGDKENVKRSVKTGMFLAIVSGAIMMVLGFSLAPTMLKATNVEGEMLTLATTYMRIYFCGLIPSMIYNVGASILRAVGDSKRPLYFLMCGCITNIILDYVFIKVLRLSVAGAAIATIMSQAISCVLTLMSLKNTEDCYSYTLKETSYEKDLFKQIIIIGMPTGIQSVMYTISNILIQSTVNSFGTDTIAAWTAFGKIDAIYWMFSGALGTACMTVAGQNFGANKLDRVKRTVRDGLILHVLGSLTISCICYFFGTYCIELFTDDPGVIEIGYSICKFLAPTWVTFSCVEILSSCIRACGDSLRPMLITAICICGFRMAWIFSCSKETIINVFKCYPLSWIIASVVFVLYYLSNIWLKYCLKKREKLTQSQGN